MAGIERKTKRYSTNLTDKEWKRFAPPAADTGETESYVAELPGRLKHRQAILGEFRRRIPPRAIR